MGRIPLVSAVRRAGNRQQIQNQQCHADIYRCVSKVKHKKVAAKGMQVEVINDGAMNNAVDSIAEGPADDQP